jgi:hypothetical protein
MERLPQGTRRLAAQLRLRVEPYWLWSALTDYDNLDRFIPNLSHSRQLSREGNQVRVEQVGTQNFCGLRFSARVLLELQDRFNTHLPSLATSPMERPPSPSATPFNRVP